LCFKQRIITIGKVAKITYQASPLMIWIQLVGSIIDAVLPLITAFFAALTTTALAEAFVGDETAGSRVVLFVIITAALGVAQTAWGSVQQYFTQTMQYKIEAAITDRMYSHFLKLDFWRYDDKRTVDVYDKAQRFASMFPYIFERLANLITQFITMIAGLVAMLLVSWWLGLIVLVAIVPGIVIQFRLSRLQMSHWSKNVETRRRRSMIEWEMFKPHHIAELRLYGMARYLLNLRQNLRDIDDKKSIEYERKYIFKRLMANVIESAAEVIALVWVALQIVAQHIPVGHFIYVQQVVSPVLSIGSTKISLICLNIKNLWICQKLISQVCD
jgi:ATP-binding cassette subfamily B protein